MVRVCPILVLSLKMQVCCDTACVVGVIVLGVSKVQAVQEVAPL